MRNRYAILSDFRLYFLYMTYISLCYSISVNYMNIQFGMGYAFTNYSRKARPFEVGHLSALMGLLIIPPARAANARS